MAEEAGRVLDDEEGQTHGEVMSVWALNFGHAREYVH